MPQAPAPSGASDGDSEEPHVNTGDEAPSDTTGVDTSDTADTTGTETSDTTDTSGG